MRVCQPGPVALQRAMTSAGRRIEMSFLGFGERGRPPLFTLARANMSDVSCGSSRNSAAPTACASTRARSDFKVRREAFLFAVIGFSHAENAASGALLFELDRYAGKDALGVGEVQAPFGQGLGALDGVPGDPHGLL